MEQIYYDSCKIGGDLQKISKILPSFPWSKYSGEHHLPGHSFTGPGTRLDLRLDEDDLPFEDSLPKNRIDAAAYKHDLAYRDFDDIENRHNADRKMIEELNAIQNPTFRERVDRALVIRMLGIKLKMGQGLSKIERSRMSKEQLEQWAKEIHKPYKKPKSLLKVKVFHKDDIWSADLIEMPKEYLGKHYKFVLTVIDLYTKFAWVRKLKNKTGLVTKEAFEDIMKTSGRKPKKLWVDQGSEYYNKVFEAMLKENNIEMYSTLNEGKAVIIENFNRILKSKLWKRFTIQGNQKWIHILQDVVDKYNNRIHSLIKVSPTEASKNPEKIRDTIMENNYKNDLEFKKEKPKFKIGDRVRIFKYKKHFDKGFTGWWTSEIFKIVEINNKSPITYEIADLDNEEILGQFYSNELQKTDF